MIEAVVQIVMSMILLIGGVIAGVSLIRMHRSKDMPSLTDLITSTDKKGRIRLDPRKCFEAGAFLTTTWAFVFLTASGKLTEFYMTAYVGAWVLARSMRDREQRLSQQPPAKTT